MIKLYHSSVSTCSQKVRWVLAEKSIDFEPHEVNLLTGEQHQDWYAKLNPDHVVPTIVHDERVVRESSLIMHYLDEISGPERLVPESPEHAYQMRLWMHLIDHKIHSETAVITFALGPRRLINAQPKEAREASIARIVDPAARARRRSVLDHGAAAPEFKTAIARFLNLLTDLNQQLESTDWIAGPQVSLADGAMLPYVLRLEHLDLMPMLGTRPAIADWLNRMMARPSFVGSIGRWIPPERITFMKDLTPDDRQTIRSLVQEPEMQ